MWGRRQPEFARLDPRPPALFRAWRRIAKSGSPIKTRPLRTVGNIMTVSPHDIARILSEAPPHMQRYDEEIVVVKYGGHPIGEGGRAKSIPREIRREG